MRTVHHLQIKVLIVALLVGAIAFAGLIYLNLHPVPSRVMPPGTSQTPQKNVSPEPSAPKNDTAKPTRAGLSADEQALISPPPPTATQAEQQAYFTLVVKSAVATDTVMLDGSCKPSPIVSQIKPGGSLTFNNTSDVSHTVSLGDAQHIFPIPPHTAKTVGTNFVKTGIYGYGCDAIQGAVGMVNVPN